MSRNTNTYVSRRRQNLTSNRSYGRNSNIAVFQPSVKMGMVAQILMVVGIFVVLCLVYLSNAVRPTAYGAEIQKIDAEISALEIKKTDLEVENARLTSLNSIENSEVAKALTTPNSVNYAE